MGTAIGDILPVAVSVAVSPVPVIAVMPMPPLSGVARIGKGIGGLTT